MLRRRPAQPNTPAKASRIATPVATDVATLLGGSLLPPALLDELWLSVGADGRRALLLWTGGVARGWSVVAGLTIVVDDLYAASARYAAQFGCAPLAVDPAEMDEAGMAQRFALDSCWLTLLTPADDTNAADFLAQHGPGIYAITVQDEVGGVVRSRQVGQ